MAGMSAEGSRESSRTRLSVVPKGTRKEVLPTPVEHVLSGLLIRFYFARQRMVTPARMAAMAMALRLRFPSEKSTAPA
jgi:hypothetical protein